MTPGRSRRGRPRGRALLLVGAGLVALGPSPSAGQDVGREAAEALRFPELRFDPPEPVRHELPGGVTVLLLEDPSLPLVDVMARFRGGYGSFGREYYAAGTALPSLLRAGGTETLAPDSVDHLIEYHAIQTSFGGGGGVTFSSMNTLAEHLDRALDLWGAMLKRPGLAEDRLEVWRGQEVENVRRRLDDPGVLAFSAFNRLMFGDHPIGWEITPEDLAPTRLTVDRVRWVHRRVFCRDNLTLGVTGAVSWNEIRPKLEALIADWPACTEPVPETPEPSIRRSPGVFLIPRPLEQSTIVVAHAAALRQEDTPDYYASRIGNAILGASGLSSRLLARLRTEEGLAYSASSLWTAPARYDGLIGGTTRTRAGATAEAIETMFEVFRGMAEGAPDADEVDRAVDEATHGFVFNFESAAQIVSRRMFYEAEGLPANWLTRYLDGIQRVRPSDVRDVYRRHLDLDRMVILVVGDPDAFDRSLDVFGPVTVLEAEGPATSRPSGSRRSPE